jgi:beta-carotene hydroxylase
MTPPFGSGLPTLDEIGRDLLEVPAWRRALSLALPFALAAAFFVFAHHGLWVPALACPVALSFLTYASISHDLVHRNLRLAPALNEVLLAAIELIAFRSGHAYRAVHLHHHATFPAASDLEGAAARMTWWRALLEGLALQPRLWLFALRERAPARGRSWVIAEGALVLFSLALCAGLFAAGISSLPLVYAALMIAGSWIYPFMTSYVPHDASGASDLTQTRLYRGHVTSWLSLEHLYHLEHHLYPGVPHHRWPQLARRLNPYFSRLGLRPIVVLF